MIRNHIKTSLLLLTATMMIISCKKKDLNDSKPPAVASEVEKIADSLFYYAKDAYLWNSEIPSYETFSPRKYADATNKFQGLSKELFAITRFGKNSKTGNPYEYDSGYPNEAKYSYVDEESFTGSKTSFVREGDMAFVDLEGKGNDFGLRVGYYGTTSNYKTYIQIVYPGSEAATAKLERGDLITEINGTKYGSNFNTESSALTNAFFHSTKITIKGTKRTGEAFDITLNKTTYNTKSVLTDSVYTKDAKKIGYFAFNSFSSLTHTKADIDKSFSKFQTAGITDLIIDLRYNGGGYINTVQYLVNKIAPSSINGKLMFSEHFNSTMQNNKTQYLKYLPYTSSSGRVTTYADLDYSIRGNTYNFEPSGNLNINSIVFIVTDNTASSSELLINVLKPYISNIKLVGERTYGKPVGFFPLVVGGYDVYMSMFESRNSNGEGSYYDGMPVDQESSDDASYLLGNLSEASLKSAYNYITTGSYTSISTKASTSINSNTNSTPLGTSSPTRFRGTIETRIKTR